MRSNVFYFYAALQCYAEPVHRRISKRKTKGKAPTPRDSDTGAGRSTYRKMRGTQDLTSSDEGDINDNDDKKMDDATPRNLKRSKAEQEYHVLVDSPPHLRPKRRQRKNEAGDAIDISEVGDDVPKTLWVGTGNVRHADLILTNVRIY